MDFLLILLAVLGIILLITLIILFVRLNFTISKIDYLLEDVSKKLNTVNHVFDVVDKVTDSVSLINDRMVDAIASFIANLFSKKRNKKETIEEGSRTGHPVPADADPLSVLGSGTRRGEGGAGHQSEKSAGAARVRKAGL